MGILGIVPSSILENPPTCPLCEDIFAFRYQLEWHYKWKHGGQLFICKECNGTYLDKSILSRHIGKFHASNYLHACEKCGYRFDSDIQLRKHQLSTHKRPQLQCRLCNRHFDQQRLYEEHIQSHDDVTSTSVADVNVDCRGCFGKNAFATRHHPNRISECAYLQCVAKDNTKIQRSLSV